MSIQTELLAIQEANPDNLLIAEEVLRWAKAHPDSVLYSKIPWDDKKAAHEYRLEVVRGLIRVHLVHLETPPMVISLSTDRKKKNGGYRAMEEVRADKSLFKIALDDALAELDRVQRKYEMLSELEPVWRAAAKIKAKLKRRSSRKETERRVTA